MTQEERFLAAAHEEGKHSISVAGSTLVASAVGVILALALMLIATRVAIFMSDRRSPEHQPLLRPEDPITRSR